MKKKYIGKFIQNYFILFKTFEVSEQLIFFHNFSNCIKALCVFL